MKLKIRLRLILLLLPFSIACFAGAEQTTIVGRVVNVHDADTITVLAAGNIQHKIRLEGIDAPERGQPYGTKATDALKTALGDGQVVVNITEQDRYGRSIGRVMAGQVDVNAWMIEKGWAWHYKAYSKDAKLADLEKQARTAKLGLWADSTAPVAPWDYRTANRAPKPAEATTGAIGGYWLNTGSNVRHNLTCKNFGKTSKGRACSKNEGKGCGICGG